MEESSAINSESSVWGSRIIENTLTVIFALSFGFYAGFHYLLNISGWDYGIGALVDFIFVGIFSFVILKFLILKILEKIFSIFGRLIFFILGLVSIAFLCVISANQWSGAQRTPPQIISATGFATKSKDSPIIFISPAGNVSYHPGGIVPVEWSIQQKSAIPYKSIDTWYVYLMKVGSQSSIDADPTDNFLAAAANGNISAIGTDNLKLPLDMSTGTYQIRVESDFLPGWAMSDSFTVE